MRSIIHKPINLAKWWESMKGPHPLIQMTLSSGGHVWSQDKSKNIVTLFYTTYGLNKLSVVDV